MQSGGIARVASRISVQLPEEGELHQRVATESGAVVGAIVGVTSRQIGIHRVIAVRDGVRYFLADFRQDRRGAVSAGGGRRVDVMANVGCSRTDRAVGAAVLIAIRSVIGIVESR